MVFIGKNKRRKKTVGGVRFLGWGGLPETYFFAGLSVAIILIDLFGQVVHSLVLDPGREFVGRDGRPVCVAGRWISGAASASGAGRDYPRRSRTYSRLRLRQNPQRHLSVHALSSARVHGFAGGKCG